MYTVWWIIFVKYLTRSAELLELHVRINTVTVCNSCWCIALYTLGAVIHALCTFD